ncbi:MAG: hypothetical protein M1819_003793 [Sarea resinae]|nr:MAG: hypothetical protein M1819_003793 [Sarea resinae]
MSSSAISTPNSGPSSSTNQDPNPPTVAAFSPSSLSHPASIPKQRSTILVHQKSPLLVATPPQITRALAYSHPFLLPLNKLAGLLSWTSRDPYESFLLLAGFWAVVLYGDTLLRWAGPIIVVVGLMVGMYSRRYSPLSSTGWTGEKLSKSHKRAESESSMRHQKSLDEIVETLRELTARCNVLLDPCLRLTDFLSTQRTATSATTRPALTTLFIRILMITPLWIALTLPPLYLITTKRIVLASGTVFLTWHSRPARVSREILWRSLTVRRISSFITGLTFDGDSSPVHANTKGQSGQTARAGFENHVASSLAAKRRGDSQRVRFTFSVYENQRRWLGIGWTYSLFAYERAAWTDEHLNAAPSKDNFKLPEVEDGIAKWQWVEGSEWRVEGAGEAEARGDGGWIYYDNKWRDGRRGEDSWGRYTRRRKWYRDAELVEISPSSSPPNAAADASTSAAQTSSDPAGTDINDGPPPDYATSIQSDAASTTSSTNATNRRSWFKSSSNNNARKAPSITPSTATATSTSAAAGAGTKSGADSGKSVDSRRSGTSSADDEHHDTHRNYEGRDGGGWTVSDEAHMGLG